MKTGGWFIELDFALVKSETRVTELCPSNCSDVNCLLLQELARAGRGAGCRENLQHRPEDAPSPRLPGATEMSLFSFIFALRNTCEPVDVESYSDFSHGMDKAQCMLTPSSVFPSF